MYVDLHFHARQLINIRVDCNTKDWCQSVCTAGIPTNIHFVVDPRLKQTPIELYVLDKEFSNFCRRTLKWHLMLSIYWQCFFFRIFVKAQKLKKWWTGRISYIMLPATLCTGRYMWFKIYSFFKMFIIFYFRCLSGHLPVNNGW